MKNTLTLIGLDIEGPWNVPLLENAAQMSGGTLMLANGDDAVAATAEPGDSRAKIGDVLDQFDHVLACEPTPRSRSVYDYAAPRGNVAVIVGNERRGIPGNILKRADRVLSIPMLGRGISSVNVAVAGAVILYALHRDLGRKRFRVSGVFPRTVDIFLWGPTDPSELGSLLRSAWAFGWQRVFLADRHHVWFTKDRPTILAGRAAARCELNRIAVSPEDHLNLDDYDQIVVCGNSRRGTPLSTFIPPDRGRSLLVFGDDDPPPGATNPVHRVYVDYAATTVDACFRHAGSILLSGVSQRLKRSRRG